MSAKNLPGLSLNELAERTRTHQSSVSAVVTRLAREGLAQKRTADGDARRVEIRLSPSGRRRLDRAPQAAQERLVASVDALPGVERARLAVALEGLVRGMALPRKRPAMFFEEPARRANVRRPRRRIWATSRRPRGSCRSLPSPSSSASSPRSSRRGC